MAPTRGGYRRRRLGSAGQRADDVRDRPRAGGALPDTAEIVAIGDCRWEDCSQIVATTNHALRRKRRLQLADVMHERWLLRPGVPAPTSRWPRCSLPMDSGSRRSSSRRARSRHSSSCWMNSNPLGQPSPRRPHRHFRADRFEREAIAGFGSTCIRSNKVSRNQRCPGSRCQRRCHTDCRP